jgi:hypothetical protein
MFFFIKAPGAHVHTQQQHPAIPHGDIVWLAEYMNQGFSFEQAIHILRRTHFPFFYDPEPWIPGMLF